MTAFFNALVNFFKNLFEWLLDGALFVIKSAFYFIFDGLLTVITLAVQALDFSSFLASYAMDWAGLPTQAIYIIVAIGIPQGLTIIATAMLIRLVLNLIPAAVTRI